MSQAQPRPPRRRRSDRTSGAGRQRPGADVADLRERREQRKKNEKAKAERQRRAQQQPRSGNADPVGQARSKRRIPLVPFALGVALGYGLAGPLPHMATGAMAALLHGPGKLAGLVNPFGLGDRQVLVLGTDKVAENTDVMFTVQVKDGTTRVTQVPRDTFVESSAYGVTKANALYALGGADAAKQEVGQLVNAPVARYLKVNLRAVQRLADALGGVDVDVPKRMYYVDNSQGLYIDLYPGRQLLKGEALEGFLRFRHDELGDLGRMERQKLVLREAFRKLAQPSTLTQLPALLKIAGDDVKTDLTPVEMGQLLTAMAGSKLATSQLAGRVFWKDDLSYWMPDSNLGYQHVADSPPSP
jgi:LCP family protein required for cell wall assembly